MGYAIDAIDIHWMAEERKPFTVGHSQLLSITANATSTVANRTKRNNRIENFGKFVIAMKNPFQASRATPFPTTLAIEGERSRILQPPAIAHNLHNHNLHCLRVDFLLLTFTHAVFLHLYHLRFDLGLACPWPGPPFRFSLSIRFRVRVFTLLRPIQFAYQCNGYYLFSFQMKRKFHAKLLHWPNGCRCLALQ